MGSKTCYAVDGSVADDIPCGFPSSNQCCGSGWDCLGNGLCQQHGTTAFSQGSCTNPEYDQCLSICNKAEYEGATEVSSCGINLWCCAGVEGLSGGASCCGTDRQTTLQPFPFQTILAGQVGPSGSSSGAVAAPTSSSTTTSSTQSTNATGSPNKTGGAASTTAPHTTPSTGAAGLSTGEKIAIGLAIPLGLLLLAALAFFIYRSEKQGRRLKELISRNGHRSDRNDLDGLVTAEAKEQTYNVYELQNVDIAEMEGAGRKPELFSRPRYEMDATTAPR